MSQRQMSSPTLTSVQQARNQQHALHAIAAGIDALAARLDALEQSLTKVQTDDSWSTWDAEPPAVRTPEHQEDEAWEEARTRRIAALELQLENAHDPDDRRAVEAALRLAKDTPANVIRATVPEGERVVDNQPAIAGSPMESIVVDGGVVDVPVVGAERQADRAEWATERKIWEFLPLGPEAAVTNYAKGGPMWLVLGNRKAVMAMPLSWRRELVKEIERDSPAEAQEVGRDILKQDDSVSQDFAINVIEGISAARG